MTAYKSRDTPDCYKKITLKGGYAVTQNLVANPARPPFCYRFLSPSLSPAGRALPDAPSRISVVPIPSLAFLASVGVHGFWARSGF